MSNGLSLDISVEQDSFSLAGTYRDEGVSIGSDHMRLYGADVEMEVSYGDLILGERLGAGACSTVNLGRHRRTSAMYAVKMFNVNDRSQAAQLYKEIKLLATVQCDCLISLKGAFHDQGCIGMIIEYMDKGSLEFMLSLRAELPEQALAAIIFQVIWGLGYLHYEGRLHRDVKPGNILMNSLGQVKLSDFGISKELDSSTAMSNTAVGTYRYMSPERLLGEKYDASGDIWSVGITMIELWTKAYPFERVADTPIGLLSELEAMNFNEVVHKNVFPKLMRNTIQSMIAFQPEKRADCPQLANAAWFESCGINTLLDAQTIVADWLKTVDNLIESMSMSASGFAKATGAAEKSNKSRGSARKDENEMSISYGSSSYGSSSAIHHPSKHARHYEPTREEDYEDDFHTDNMGDSYRYDSKQEEKTDFRRHK